MGSGLSPETKTALLALGLLIGVLGLIWVLRTFLPITPTDTAPLDEEAALRENAQGLQEEREKRNQVRDVSREDLETGLSDLERIRQGR